LSTMCSGYPPGQAPRVPLLDGGYAWQRPTRFLDPPGAGAEHDHRGDHDDQHDDGGQDELNDGNDAGRPGLIQAGQAALEAWMRLWQLNVWRVPRLPPSGAADTGVLPELLAAAAAVIVRCLVVRLGRRARPGGP
jgi:hypothetical protein